eukprot:6464261-Pyramimonas_sp.AAC.1
MEFEKRKESLRDGVQKLASDLFKQVVDAVQDAKNVHVLHMSRLIPKRRKNNEGGAQPAGAPEEGEVQVPRAAAQGAAAAAAATGEGVREAGVEPVPTDGEQDAEMAEPAGQEPDGRDV